jgi:hypothetical protein
MQISFASFGRSTAGAVALAIGASLVAIGASLVAAPPVLAKDAPPPKITNSAEFSKVAGPFQKNFMELAAKKGKVSDDELKAAAVAMVPALMALEPNVKSPLDHLIFGDWERQIGGWSGDNALLAKGLQNMLDSGQLPPDKALLVATIMGQTAYAAKDYPTAIKVLGPLVTNPATQDVVPEMVAEADAASGQPKQGLDVLKSAIATRKAANLPVPEDWYNRGKMIAYNAKLPAESVEWGMLLVQAFPSALGWMGAAELVLFNDENLTAQDQLDIYRLMDQSGALKLEPKYTDRKYVGYVQALDARLFPGETERVAQQGIAAGALKADDVLVKEALTQSRARLAEVKASLPSLAKEAASSPKGKVAEVAGDTYLSFGDAANADTMYNLALSKGVDDVDKGRVLTRLGIAEIDEGKYADAKATLAKVGGTRTDVAKLWIVYADQKAAGK